MTDAISQAREALARHESQNASDPFHFALTDHRYIALAALIDHAEQVERERDEWREEAEARLREAEACIADVAAMHVARDRKSLIDCSHGPELVVCRTRLRVAAYKPTTENGSER